MEIEIGEVRYTEATPEQRDYMEKVQAALRADLFRHFPTLYEDDQPKYSEAFLRIEKKLPLVRRMIAVRESVFPLSIAGLGVAALLGVGVTMGRRRRQAAA
jgi:hypothetical protein